MTTRNRGKESSDDKYFAPRWHPVFREAVNDICFLLTRGYSESAALEVAGNRYRLNRRQRSAMARIACSDQEIQKRERTRCNDTQLKDRIVEIDGFNLLILLESALSGAYILKGRDGLYRDIASVHGSYHRVVRTAEAILLAGDYLKSKEVRAVIWYLDQPVSNSGRLKTQLMDISRERDHGWEVELAYNPDKLLAASKNMVITSDSWILDHACNWYNLGAELIENKMKDVNLIMV